MSRRVILLIVVLSFILGSGGTYVALRILSPQSRRTPPPPPTVEELKMMELYHSFSELKKRDLISQFTPDDQFFYTFPLVQGKAPSSSEYAEFFRIAKAKAVSGTAIHFQEETCLPFPPVLALKRGEELQLTNKAPVNITVWINGEAYQVISKSGMIFKWDFGPVGTLAQYKCNEENAEGDQRGFVLVTE